MTTDKKVGADTPKLDRQNGQGEHAGVSHAPEEFDEMNPAKISQTPAIDPRKD